MVATRIAIQCNSKRINYSYLEFDLIVLICKTSYLSINLVPHIIYFFLAFFLSISTNFLRLLLMRYLEIQSSKSHTKSTCWFEFFLTVCKILCDDSIKLRSNVLMSVYDYSPYYHDPRYYYQHLSLSLSLSYLYLASLLACLLPHLVTWLLTRFICWFCDFCSRRSRDTI